MSNLPSLLFLALVVVLCSGHLVRDSKDIMKKRHCTWLGCHTNSNLPRKQRWPRALPEEQPDTTFMYSDLPSGKILQEVKSQYMSKDEEAEIIHNENKEVDNNRNKRGIRATVIRVCNRRTGVCRAIVIYQRY